MCKAADIIRLKKETGINLTCARRALNQVGDLPTATQIVKKDIADFEEAKQYVNSELTKYKQTVWGSFITSANFDSAPYVNVPLFREVQHLKSSMDTSSLNIRSTPYVFPFNSGSYRSNAETALRSVSALNSRLPEDKVISPHGRIDNELLWRKIRLLTNRNACKNYVLSNRPYPVSVQELDTIVEVITHSIKQAYEYFILARQATIYTKPLLLYYGYTNLVKVLLITKRRLKTDGCGGHGLGFDETTKDIIERSGLFRILRQMIDTDHVFTGPYTDLYCYGLIPELADHFLAVYGRNSNTIKVIRECDISSTSSPLNFDFGPTVSISNFEEVVGRNYFGLDNLPLAVIDDNARKAMFDDFLGQFPEFQEAGPIVWAEHAIGFTFRERYKGLHSNPDKQNSYISIRVNAESNPEKLKYLYRIYRRSFDGEKYLVFNNGMKQPHPILPIHILLYKYGMVVRYRPWEFDSLLDSSRNMIESFLTVSEDLIPMILAEEFFNRVLIRTDE